MKTKAHIKILLSFFIFSMFFVPFFSFANIFPEGTKSEVIINNTNFDVINHLWLSNSDNHIRTILSISYSSKSAKSIKVFCDGNIIYDNQATNIQTFQVFTSIYCNQNIYLDNMAHTATRIAYIDADLSTPYNISGFSQGEMFISLLLLVGLIISIVGLIFSSIFSVDIHKTQELRNSEGKKTYKI